MQLVNRRGITSAAKFTVGSGRALCSPLFLVHMLRDFFYGPQKFPKKMLQQNAPKSRAVGIGHPLKKKKGVVNPTVNTTPSRKPRKYNAHPLVKHDTG